MTDTYNILEIRIFNFEFSDQCHLFICTCQSRGRIEIEINDFMMIQSNGCDIQSISFYDDVVSETTLATEFCGDGHPHRLTSKSSTLIMKIKSNTGMPAKYEIKYRSNMDWDQLKAYEDKNGKGQYPGKTGIGKTKGKTRKTTPGKFSGKIKGKIAKKKMVNTKNLGKVVTGRFTVQKPGLTSSAKKTVPAQLTTGRLPRNSWNQQPTNVSVLKISQCRELSQLFFEVAQPLSKLCVVLG